MGKEKTYTTTELMESTGMTRAGDVERARKVRRNEERTSAGY